MTTYPIRWHKTSHGYSKNGNKIRERESFVLITEQGAIEGWRTPAAPGSYGFSGGYYGGIEVHSKTQLYGFAPDPSHEHCEWTNGPCWHDGSSLAYDQIEHAFNADSPNDMFMILQEWADTRFTKEANHGE